VERAGFERWLDAYFHAWETNDADDVAALFTEDAVYQVDPFREPWRGRDEIVRWWVEGGANDVEHAYEVIAVDRDVGVASWHAITKPPGDAVEVEHDGVLVVTIGPDGRCRDHREWYARRTRG
jgi:uncharacterized protein (TIGR02246 family)